MASDHDAARRIAMAALAALPLGSVAHAGFASDRWRSPGSRILLAYFSRSRYTHVVAGLIQRARRTALFERVQLRAMQDALRAGKVRAIGVSNFHPDLLVDITGFNDIVAAVNQVEINPFHQQAHSIGFMREKEGCRQRPGLLAAVARPKSPPMKTLHLHAWAAVAGCAVALLAGQAQAEANRVTFPRLEELVHYTTVKRGNVTEHISTTRAAIEAAQKGLPIPNGTHFVLADYRDEKIYRYFVMEKGAGWGADFAERRRTGDWQFQWFWPDQKINLRENSARCMACHSSQKDKNHLFTADRLTAFRGKPVE